MHVGEDPNVAVHELKKFGKPKQKTQHKASHSYKHGASAAAPRSKLCSRCNKNHSYKACPAKGRKCNQCGKMDHFAVACKTRGKYEVRQVETEEFDFDALYVGTLSTNKKSKNKSADLFEEPLTINDVEMQFQLYTGAKCNVLT